MFRKVFFAVAVIAGLTPSCAKAFGLSFGLNEEEVKDVVRKFIYDNPQVIIESFQRMQIMEEQNRLRQTRARLAEYRKDLEYDPETPIMGNPDGDVVIVEFFDYNCGYCKLMYKKVSEAVEKDGNMRWVLKDMPTLSESSMTAALAGLAANKQGKYTEMHRELMLTQGGLDDKKIRAAAKKIGLDMKKFDQDVKSEEFQKHLEKNMTLARELSMSGIPQFIIGDFLSQGAMMGNELEEAAKVVRFKPGQKTDEQPAEEPKKEADVQAK